MHIWKWQKFFDITRERKCNQNATLYSTKIRLMKDLFMQSISNSKRVPPLARQHGRMAHSFAANFVIYTQFNKHFSNETIVVVFCNYFQLRPCACHWWISRGPGLMHSCIRPGTRNGIPPSLLDMITWYSHCAK